jgi:hypothetical protein
MSEQFVGASDHACMVGCDAGASSNLVSCSIKATAPSRICAAGLSFLGLVLVWLELT